ncbi:MAG: response regulator [Syntrophorhabdaceae bacterium]|nr:response regulator [Syntrophorhabdaceae bacterium]
MDKGFLVLTADTAEEGLEWVEGAAISVAMISFELPEMSGIELLAEVKRRSPSTEVVMMTSGDLTDSAIEAIRKNAYGCIRKPFDDLERQCVMVRQALEKHLLTLRNHELKKELERQNQKLAFALKRQKSLIDAGRAMGGILAISDLLDYFVECVADELDVERASLMLLDETTDEMRIVAHKGLSPDVTRDACLKVGDGIAGSVAREGKPILVTDVESDPRVGKGLESTSASSFISAPIVLSIPILIREKVLGVINATNRRNGASFDEDDMTFLFSLAGQAAVAIERARQFEELQGAYKNLQDAQKRLIESERLKAIGQIAGGVAHEFNNLLSGVLGQAEMLRIHMSAAPPDINASLKRASLIESLAQQGAAAVRRIQDYTRIRKDAPSGVVDINAVVRNAFDATRGKWDDECQKRGINISVRLETGTVPMTAGDETELTQVVSNLILNAVDALGSGGDIVLTTWSDEKEIFLSVTDSGVGMAPETQRRIFEPYFTTKERGQGLGMGVIYGIVTRHQGEIIVRSEEGKGTTFELRLPIIVSSAEECPDGPEKAVADPARVLLVDDSDLNRELFGNYLSQLRHEAILAANGMEALSILKRERVDLVITDLNMPGLTGWDVAEMVKKRYRDVPVILISGLAIQQDEPRIAESGVDYVLQKPCGMSRFQEVVQKTIASAAAERKSG